MAVITMYRRRLLTAAAIHFVSSALLSHNVSSNVPPVHVLVRANDCRDMSLTALSILLNSARR